VALALGELQLLLQQEMTAELSQVAALLEVQMPVA
jgi:hypothetical protein